MKRQINQRDVYYCDFGDNDGSEQSGERPSLIISNDLGNVNSDTIIVLPITSKKKKSTISVLLNTYILFFLIS